MPLRLAQVRSLFVVGIGLLFCGGTASAEPSEYCGDFFDEILDRMGGDGYLFRPLESLDKVLPCLNGESVICINDDGSDPFELPVGYFLAVELPAGVDLGRLETMWEINGKRLAVCSESPWYPPPIRVNSYAAFSAGIALANVVWDAASEQVPYKDTYLRSRGNGVFLQDATLDLTGFPDAGGDVASLVRQYTRNALDQELDPKVVVDGIAVTGSEGVNVVLASLVSATPDGLACDSAGDLDFEGIAWSGLEAESAVFEPLCLDTDGRDQGGEFLEGTQTVSLRTATLDGSGSGLREQPLVASAGWLDLEDVSAGAMQFSGSAAFSAATAMTVTGGSSFVGLTSATDGDAAFVATSGDLKAQDVLFSDLDGWGTVTSGSKVGLGGAYVCGVQAGALMVSSSDPGGTLDLVSSAVVGSQFASAVGEGVPAAAEPAAVRLANVLFAGLSKDGSAPTSLAGHGADVEGTNLLAYQSLATAGTGDAQADGVRLWSDEAAGQDCGSWGLPSGCAALSDSPTFTADPAVLLQADCSAVAPGLQELVSAEDEGGDEILRVESLGFLPVLFTDETDLVGAGSAWTLEESLLDCAPPGDDTVDVGAYGGPCSLSFLEPLEVEEVDEPEAEDSGALDTARPETVGDGGGTAIPGLGAGCRYGSLAGLVVVPLGVAWRRRRQRG